MGDLTMEVNHISKKIGLQMLLDLLKSVQPTDERGCNIIVKSLCVALAVFGDRVAKQKQAYINLVAEILEHTIPEKS